MAFLAGLAFAGPAFAHAVLISANPTEGSVLERAPRMVQLRFNEPVEALALRMIDAHGEVRDLSAMSQGAQVEAALPDDLPEGTQVLSYRVVSLDGHPIGASLSFSIGMEGRGTAAPTPGPSIAAALWGVRALEFTLLLGGAGMAFFFTFLSPAPASFRFRRTSLAAFGLAMALVILSAGLQGLGLLGLPPAALAGLAPWRAVSGSSFALTALFEMTAFVFATLALQRDKPSKLLGLLALGCIGCARASSGHAALADPAWLMRPALFLHAVTAAIWAGALTPLLWLAATDADAFKRALRRFSSIAVATVAVLLALGCVIAGVQMREPYALLGTDYGRLLALKLGLVAPLLLLALWNRRIGAPLALTSASGAIRRIGRTIAAEIVLMICIFAVIAAWRFTPPPRALIEARGMDQLAVWSGHTQTVVRIEPGRLGENLLSVDLLDHAAKPVPAMEVTVTLSAPWLGLEPRVLAAGRSSDGGWRIPSLYLPAAGDWTVTIEALVSDFDKHTATGIYRIAP